MAVSKQMEVVMKKKKLIAGVLAFSMALSCTVALPENYGSVVERVYAGGFGTHGTTDSTGVYNVEKSGNGFTIKSIQDKTLTTYNIPATLTATIDNTTYTLSVTGLGETLFQGRSDITSVTLPNSITTIGTSAFSKCSSLKTVNIPTSLTEIPNNCFASCTSLTKVTIPSGVTTIGENAYASCSGVTSLSISSTVTSVKSEAFLGCTSLLEVTVPETVTEIGNLAFGFASENTKVDNFVLKCNIDSEADKYATKAGLTTYYIDNPGHTHNYTVSETKAATCGEDGYTRYTCSCGSTYDVKSYKTGKHTLDKGVVVAPTYTERGYTLYTCTVCGYSYKDNYTAMLSKTDISSATVSGVKTSYQYTGSAITIDNDITVTLDGKTLVKGTDYTIGSYKNNTAAGNNTASCVITGQGAYSGTQTVYFTISSSGSGESSETVDISGATITYTDTQSSSYSTEYTGEAIKPRFAIKLGSTTLTVGRYITVAYSNNVNPGTATITATGTGNVINGKTYTGTAKFTFTITQAGSSQTTTDLSGATVTLSPSSATYTGSAVKPTPTVKVGSTTLTAGTDYTVSYSNNTNAGTATVTITGKGNYTGTVSKTFTISAVSISSATVTLPKTSYTYTGSAINPTPTVKVGSTTLTAGTDYTVSYKDNTNAGTATVTITGKGNYKDSALKTFTITANSGRVPGDANGDGIININDVLLIQQFIAEWNVDVIEANCDVNGDQKVNINDVLLIQQKIAQWDVELI